MSDNSRAASRPASQPAAGENVRRMAHRAMWTIFEILIVGLDEATARDAAEAAFAEIDRLEKLLSRFRPYSDISRINAADPGKDVVVEVETAECIEAARKMWERTGGAFDITAGSPPTDVKPSAGRKAPTGMKRIAIDADNMSVRRLDGTVRLDLGGIGKGYAVDRTIELLSEEWSVGDALVSGGTSTVRAIGRGHHADIDGWQVDLRDPSNDRDSLASVVLRDRSFSGSSTAQSRHIVDPRTGKHIGADHAAWARTENATVADATTTALCVMDGEEIVAFSKANPKLPFVIGRHVEGKWRLDPHGPKMLKRL